MSELVGRELFIDEIRQAAKVEYPGQIVSEIQRLQRVNAELHEHHQLHDRIFARQQLLIKEAQAQLAALRLTWTSERPTQPGWYWRKAPKGGPWVVEITVSDIAKNFPPSYFAKGGQWCGPLPLPSEG